MGKEITDEPEDVAPLFFQLPRDVLRPFILPVAPDRFASFLPPVLWPVNHGLHSRALVEERSLLLQTLTSLSRTRVGTALRNPLRRSPRRSGHGQAEPPRLVWYHPLTPYIIRFAYDPVLRPHDMLYYMECFYGHCLVDRTGTLNRCIETKVLTRIPEFDPDFSKGLADTCISRANDIVDYAYKNGVSIKVLWFGGIYSTIALTMLLYVTKGLAGDLISVLCTYDSVREFSSFYDAAKNFAKFDQVESMPNVYETHSGEPPCIVVTGELGDQIIGNDFRNLLERRNNITDALHNASTPWTSYFPRMLVRLEAIPRGAAKAWLSWIWPQVRKAPIPITTTAEMFWWINFSLTWQHVQVRLVVSQKHPSEDVLRRTHHFFDSDDFQQWSLHHHWRTHLDKHGYECRPESIIQKFINHINRTERVINVGAVEEKPWEMTDESGFAANIALDEDGWPLQFGTHSICLELLQDKYGYGNFLPREIAMDKSQVAVGAAWTPSSVSMFAMNCDSQDHDESSTYSQFEREMYHPLSEEVRKYSFTHQYQAVEQSSPGTPEYLLPSPTNIIASSSTSSIGVSDVIESTGCCMQTLTSLLQSLAE